MSKFRVIRQSQVVRNIFHYSIRTTYVLLMTCEHQSQSHHHRRLTGINKTGREEASLAGALESPFVPSIIPLLVNVNNVPQLQLQLIFTVGGVWHDASEPLPDEWCWLLFAAWCVCG